MIIKIIKDRVISSLFFKIVKIYHSYTKAVAKKVRLKFVREDNTLYCLKTHQDNNVVH